MHYNTGNNPLFNGNISQIDFTINGNQSVSSYDYTYDGLNRILSANYTDASDRDFSTTYNYDLNGNIQHLTRMGFNNTNYVQIDDLSYTYYGNQLNYVDDLNTPDNQNFGFVDNGSFRNVQTEHALSLTDNDYAYDANGNLVQDLNKEIYDIQYNHMNLPTQISFYDEFAGEKFINYLYSENGTKLRVQTLTGSNQNTTDYAGNFVYQDGELNYILMPEGRIVLDNSINSITFNYFLTDHLGNNRALIDQSCNLLQENHYYPFGMQINALSHSTAEPDNNYLYNGKELQPNFGLDWYEYGARMYDPQIARWSSVDAMAEEYLSWSPYNYTMNNPIRFIDPNGMWVDNYVFDQNGTFVRKEENDEPDKIVIENSTTGDIDAELEVGADETLEDNFYQVDDETGFKNITDHNQAKSIFEFFADNTDVEWGWGETPVNTNDVFTVNGKKNIQVPSLEFYDKFTHNHPSGTPIPSGRVGTKVVDADLKTAAKYPSIQYFIYVKGNKKGFPKGYYNFNKKGLNPIHQPNIFEGKYEYSPTSSKDF